MEIVEYEKLNEGEWDNFCLASDDAWFWHTTEWIEYTLAYSENKSPKNHSFLVRDGKKNVGIFPLIMEEENGVKEFSFGGVPGFSPALSNDLSQKEKDAVLKFMFEKMDSLAKEHGVSRSRIRFTPLSPSQRKNKGENYLPKFGFLDASIHTQIIDLRLSIDELRKNIRHGHDSDIKRGLKELTTSVYDAKTLTPEIFANYTTLRTKTSQKQVRPSKTFELMYDWVKAGKAILVAAMQKDKYIGFSYVFIYKDGAYYGSACNEPDMEKLPIAHVIQWATLEYLKAEGVHFYEIGWQVYGSGFNDFSSDKEIAISRFKRGFGGEAVLLFMGEKYYDKDLFKKVYVERIERIAPKIGYEK